VSVSDNGCGISDEDCRRSSSPSFPPRRGRRHRARLSITYGLVQRWRQIAVESELGKEHLHGDATVETKEVRDEGPTCG